MMMRGHPCVEVGSRHHRTVSIEAIAAGVFNRRHIEMAGANQPTVANVESRIRATSIFALVERHSDFGDSIAARFIFPAAPGYQAVAHD